MKKDIRSLLILLVSLMCLTLVACGVSPSPEGTYAIEELVAEEFTYYADNANVFADDVLDSGAKFLYLQLPYTSDEPISEDDLTIANHNADGICSMIENDHHDVLDARDVTDATLADVAGLITEKLQLEEESRILLIGDSAAAQLFDELANTYGSMDYKSSMVVDRDNYDAVYECAVEGNFDAVIVANDTAAFHYQSFPFSAE